LDQSERPPRPDARPSPGLLERAGAFLEDLTRDRGVLKLFLPSRTHRLGEKVEGVVLLGVHHPITATGLWVWLTLRP